MRLDEKKYGEKFVEKFNIGVRETKKLRKYLKREELEPVIKELCEYFEEHKTPPSKMLAMIEALDLSRKVYDMCYDRVCNSRVVPLSGQMYLKPTANPNSHNYIIGKVYRIYGPPGYVTRRGVDSENWCGNNLPATDIDAATNEEIFNFLLEEHRHIAEQESEKETYKPSNKAKKESYEKFRIELADGKIAKDDVDFEAEW